MKKITIIIYSLFLFNARIVFSQIAFTDILNSNIEVIDKHRLVKSENVLYLETGFGESLIKNPDDLAMFKNDLLLKVELIYTKYKKSDKFNQSNLNSKRLESLNNKSRSIFENDIVEWQLIEQTVEENDLAKESFHGFKLTYRNKPTEENTLKEIDFIENYLTKNESKTIDYELVDNGASINIESFNMNAFLHRNLYYPSVAIDNDIEGNVFVGLTIGVEGDIINSLIYRGIGFGCDKEALRVCGLLKKWNPARKKGKPIISTVTIPILFQLDNYKKSLGDSLISEIEEPYSETTAIIDKNYNYLYKEDSTIYKVFERNSNWSEMSIVCDFTGSMFRYTAQLLLWHKMNILSNRGKVQQFTFFNDGDRKDDNKKIIGNTGGIYQNRTKKFKEIQNLAITTMKNGNGGDLPENNIEAVLQAIESCPECKEFVLIADNYATPRDLDLLNEIDKPIKLILCGTNAGFNIEYLDMIREVGGSVHTIEQDILNLASLKENEKVKIGLFEYLLFKGKFKKLIR